MTFHQVREAWIISRIPISFRPLILCGEDAADHAFLTPEAPGASLPSAARHASLALVPVPQGERS